MRITFQDITDWMTGEAPPEVVAAIQKELDDPISPTCRHLDWMADPAKHALGRNTDPLVAEMIAAGRKATHGVRRRAPKPSPEILQAVPLPRPQLGMRTFGRVGSIAASLLVGTTIGLISGRAFRQVRPDETDRPLATAAGTLEFARRGPSLVPTRVDVTSDLDGFATVIVISISRKPLVVPLLGGASIRVGPDRAKAQVFLPEVASRAEVALIIVTPTPAESVVRTLLGDREFGPRDIARLHAFLDRELRADNYRSLAFAEVPLSPPNTPSAPPDRPRTE